MTKTIIIPLPCHDFDPTEVSIPWKVFKANGFDIFFATPDGHMSVADSMMVSGEGLDPWGWIPVIKKIRLIGLGLRADKNARAAHQELLVDKNFQNPCKYTDLDVDNYDALH